MNEPKLSKKKRKTYEKVERSDVQWLDKGHDVKKQITLEESLGEKDEKVLRDEREKPKVKTN